MCSFFLKKSILGGLRCTQKNDQTQTVAMLPLQTRRQSPSLHWKEAHVPLFSCNDERVSSLVRTQKCSCKGHAADAGLTVYSLGLTVYSPIHCYQCIWQTPFGSSFWITHSKPPKIGWPPRGHPILGGFFAFWCYFSFEIIDKIDTKKIIYA